MRPTDWDQQQPTACESSLHNLTARSRREGRGAKICSLAYRKETLRFWAVGRNFVVPRGKARSKDALGRGWIGQTIIS